MKTARSRYDGPRAIRRLVCAALISGAALYGCQSSQEARMAEQRDLLRQQQDGNVAPTSTPPAAGSASNVATSGGPSAGLDMPIYPGARRLDAGAGRAVDLGDGLSMALLETTDSVDKVIAFYSDRLKPADPRFQTTRTEETLDRHRVVRLSIPRENGGLQTVEARDEEGKTAVQLMSMAGKPGAYVPKAIPGVPGGGLPGLDNPPPADLTAPPGHSGQPDPSGQVMPPHSSPPLDTAPAGPR